MTTGNGGREAQEGDAGHAWYAARWRHGLLKCVKKLGGPDDVSGPFCYAERP